MVIGNIEFSEQSDVVKQRKEEILETPVVEEEGTESENFKPFETMACCDGISELDELLLLILVRLLDNSIA